MNTAPQPVKVPALKKSTETFGAGDNAFRLLHCAGNLREYDVREALTDRIIVSGSKSLRAVREDLSYVLTAQNYIESLGGVLEASTRRYRLETKFGPMYVSLYRNWIACRFDNAKEAAATLGATSVNDYSGKYNRHFQEKATVEERLIELVAHIEPTLGEREEGEPKTPKLPKIEIPKNYKTSLNKNELKALIQNACDDDSRPNLNGVFFYYGGAIATDGHSAFGYAETSIKGVGELGWSNHLGLPEHATCYTLPTLREAAKFAKKGDEIRIDTKKNEAAIFRTENGRSIRVASFPLKKASKAKFDLDRVFPQRVRRFGQETKTCGTVGFNAYLMDRLLKGITAVTSHKSLSTTIFAMPTDPYEPVRMDHEEVDTGRLWTAIAMPVRC